MAVPKPKETPGKIRKAIAAKVRELRTSRGWTQAELARQLQLSQNRLSEIERGDGSFTAEQFLLLLRLFNVGVSEFVSGPDDHGPGIQNALARLGALHLQESVQVLPSEHLEEVHDVVREAVIDGSPRIITALAPVLVRNAGRLNLAKLQAELEVIGRSRRLAWVIDNTLTALQDLSRGSTDAHEWSKRSRGAELRLMLFLDYSASLPRGRLALDILDATVRSRRTLEEVQRTASKASQRWGIVTSLQPEDFVQALKAAGRRQLHSPNNDNYTSPSVSVR
jgi:transcriptional regulator with XRE-family HTH domain